MTNDLKKWLNKKESSKEIVTDSLIQKYKACLSADVDVKNLLGLHWCLTQPKETRLNLNIDGHIKKGNFMPPIPLEQRMWAASSISFFEDLSSVNEIERFSEIKKIERKISKNSGELYFVEIEHNYYSEKILLIRETQSLVYKEFSSIKIKKPLIDIENKKILKKVMPDNTMLFRFSAITFNSHRIHYDKDYAIKKENYPDLVVQGPLIATIVMNLIQSNNSAHHLKEFNFINVSPAFVNQNLIICANEKEVLVVNDNNEILMEGKYKF